MRIYATEVEVMQQKSSLASLPPGKRATAMETIASKTKEIIATHVEQQSISELITTAIDKALIFIPS
jgi:hypothetical protein